MDYNQYFGYSPMAPQYAYSAPGPAMVAATGDVPETSPVGPASFSASGSFAVAGWLAAGIVILAAYRYLWEKAG